MKLYEYCILLAVYYCCEANWRAWFTAIFAAFIFAWLEHRKEQSESQS